MPDTLLEGVVLREYDGDRLRMQLRVRRAAIPASDASRVRLEELALTAPDASATGTATESLQGQPLTARAPRGDATLDGQSLSLRGGVTARLGSNPRALRFEAPAIDVQRGANGTRIVAEGPVRARFSPPAQAGAAR